MKYGGANAAVCADVDTYTIPHLLLNNLSKHPNKVAVRKKDRGIWQEYTWREIYTRVRYLALGFIALGLQKGDKVTFIGDNDPELEEGIIAVQSCGGITAGAYPDSLPHELKYITEHSESRFAIAADQEQVDKFVRLKEELPLLEKVIYWDAKGLAHYASPFLMSYEQLMQLGKEYEQRYPTAFEERIATTEPDDVCALFYTSGTTAGRPKGAVLTHRSLIKFGEGTVHKCEITPGHNLVSFVSSAFIGAAFVITIPWLLTGATVNYPEEVETINRDMREIGPEVVSSVPRNWENMAAMAEMRIMDAGFLKRLCYRLFMRVGFKRAGLSYKGKKPNILWRLLFYLAEIALFHPLKDKLGLSRARVVTTGSAQMSPDTFRFWRALGLSLRQIYAGTEAGYISGHEGNDIKDDTVGTLVPGVEARVAEDGELLVRSESMFQGYYKAEQESASAIERGWFHTGDAVDIRTDDGHLVYLDRVKHLAKLNTGETFAPGYIEGRLRHSPYIKDAVVLGHGRDFVSALIAIRYDNVGRWAEKNHISYTTYTNLSQKDEVAELISKEIERVNQGLPAAVKIKRYVLLHKELDPDEAELTRTQKLRRPLVEKRYESILDSIYNGRDEVSVEATVTYQDGRQVVTKTAIKIRNCDERAR